VRDPAHVIAGDARRSGKVRRMTAGPFRQSRQIGIARRSPWPGADAACHFIQKAIARVRLLLVRKIAFAVNGPQEKTRALVQRGQARLICRMVGWLCAGRPGRENPGNWSFCHCAKPSRVFSLIA
jgi:hypothetical protein